MGLFITNPSATESFNFLDCRISKNLLLWDNSLALSSKAFSQSAFSPKTPPNGKKGMETKRVPSIKLLALNKGNIPQIEVDISIDFSEVGPCFLAIRYTGEKPKYFSTISFISKLCSYNESECCCKNSR